jgi:hypothetical protein
LFGADVGLGSVVKMNRGILEGLTIIGGYALSGGGIFAEGTAVIKNCIIRRNRAVINETANIQIYRNGMGGGIYLKEDEKLIFCRITRNHSQREGGGNPVRLTYKPGRSTVNLALALDGDVLVFSSNRDGGSVICTMDVNGGNLSRLTDVSGIDRVPQFRPRLE